MRKLFALFLIAGFIFDASAHCEPESILHIRSTDHSEIKVMFDGQPVQACGKVVNIARVAPGTHSLKVLTKDYSWGYEVLETAFRGPVEVEPAAEIYISVCPESHTLHFDQVLTLGRPLHDYQDQWQNRPPVRPYQEQISCTRPVVCQEVEKPRVCSTPRPQPMEQCEFNRLIESMEHTPFASTRFTIFKQALPYNYFTTSQVCRLMDVFPFESYKLDVAKLAYAKTLDQQNYYVVNNSFTFSSSVDDLNGYIAMR